ncbi:MAG: XRE family transcriptional regulator [Spirochaetes bacterium]|nr:MAG: XRE family transcriptional regulator [Spirochaetota bacterium]
MSDVEKYIAKREKKTPGFRKAVMEEYDNLRIGSQIKLLRTKKGMTQEEFAKKLKTTKSAVSRLENHAESMRLSTLEKVADVLGKKLVVNFK